MINSYLFESIDDAIYEDDYTYYYDDIEEDKNYDSNEVPVLDQVQMLELGLLTGTYSVDSLYEGDGEEQEEEEKYHSNETSTVEVPVLDYGNMGCRVSKGGIQI